MADRVVAARVVAALRAAGCVFAEDEARLLAAAADSPARLDAMVARRVAGEPLEYVLGWAQFCGRRFAVAPGVFVPRRRTEFLVARAAALTAPGAVLLDLCCGCGAVGGSVAAAVGGVTVHAVDLDPAAVACARANLPGAAVYKGDLYAPLPAALRGRVDTLVVIAPYVPTAAIRLMPPEAREHEPRAALDGGPDGLDVLRRVIDGAAGWLAAGGHLLTETGPEQAAPAVDALRAAGLDARVATDDDGDDVVVIGRR